MRAKELATSLAKGELPSGDNNPKSFRVSVLFVRAKELAIISGFTRQGRASQ